MVKTGILRSLVQIRLEGVAFKSGWCAVYTEQFRLHVVQHAAAEIDAVRVN